MATTTSPPAAIFKVPSSPHRRKPPSPCFPTSTNSRKTNYTLSLSHFSRLSITCKATEVSGGDRGTEISNWVPVVPLAALPKGERRVIVQDGETILLLWYKDDIFAIENRSPAEGAYSEGLLNAKLTQDGCIVCPTTDSTFDLRTGAIKEWYPKNPVLRVLTPALRTLFVYPVKADGENIYISMRGGSTSTAETEIVFSGKAQPGMTATDVNVDEVRMVVDEDLEGFGFTVSRLPNYPSSVCDLIFLLLCFSSCVCSNTLFSETDLVLKVPIEKDAFETREIFPSGVFFRQMLPLDQQLI